jgi:SPP1 gp7 family putative phage head morphogenesis protein
MAVMRRSLDESFNQISRDMLGTYRRLEGADPRYIQVELAKLQKANIARQILSPEKADQFEAIMQTLLEEQTANGVKYSDLMTAALSNPPELVQQFGNINIEAVAAIAKDGRKRLQNHSEDAATKIIDAVANNLLQGGSMAKLTSTISGQLGLVKHRAENIARTSTMTAFNQASKKRYEGYGVKYVQIIALVDKRTTPWCRWRHMRIVEITAAMPPFHFQCRTTTAPVDPAWLSEDDLKWMQDEMAAAKKTGLVNMNRAPFDEKKPTFYTPSKFKNNIAPFKPKKQAIAKPADKPVDVTPQKPQRLTRQELTEKGRVYAEKILNDPANKGEQNKIKSLTKKIDERNTEVSRLRSEMTKLYSGSDLDGYFKLMKEKEVVEKQVSALRQSLFKEEQKEFDALISALKARGKNSRAKSLRSVEKTITFADPPTRYRGVKAIGKAKHKEITAMVDDYIDLTGGFETQQIKFYRAGKRASADKDIDGSPGLNVGSDLDKTTLFHEMSHHMEFNDPKKLEMAVDFILSRSTSPTPVSLKKLTGINYSRSEIAYPDNFLDAYVGKEYKNLDGTWNATEVYPMGIQQFADPIKLKAAFEKDPEFMHFITGVLLENHEL